jgi:hypothetical protein
MGHAGSHFRYGTMNWEAVGDLSGTSATVDIELEIGYRRDYVWGNEKLESVCASRHLMLVIRFSAPPPDYSSAHLVKRGPLSRSGSRRLRTTPTTPTSSGRAMTRRPSRMTRRLSQTITTSPQ